MGTNARRRPRAAGLKLCRSARSSRLLAKCLGLALVSSFMTTAGIAQDSLNMSLAARWHVDTIPATWMYGNVYNAVWGYVRDGHEYGIIGSTAGTHIIDVTNPPNIVETAFIPGAFQGTDVIHREFKTYQDRLYAVTDEGIGTLQIIDLRWLPDSAPVIYNSHALFYRAHTLWIDTLHARLYTWAGSSQAAVYDISNPDQPALLNDCEDDIPWWGSEIGWVHDGYVTDNVAYVNHMEGMAIVDFTNINAPQLLGTLDNYPQPGYNHSGWLHDNGWLYVMADETHGTDLKLFDVSDPNDIEFIDTIGVELSEYSIPHNPHFHGDLLHVSYYYDGYWLWNVADPANAQLLGYYDTSLEPHDDSYEGAWGVYPYLPSGRVLVSDMQRGLFVIDISAAVSVAEESALPAELRAFPNPASECVSFLGVGVVQQVDLLAADGKTLAVPFTAQSGRCTLDLSGVTDGVYVARIRAGGRVLSSRIVKQSVR